MLRRTLRHYRIVEHLGSGGMGDVYRAHDTRLDRDVAIKLLPERGDDNPGLLDRFKREARVIAAIEHPNICTIYEIGESEEGQLFIAMALCRGEALSAKISRDPLPIDEAVDVAAQVAAGLQRAHEQGIVHRDVKPANIIVSDHGEVKIVDFGIARDARAKRLTETGKALGTLAYMPPEQLRGKDIDHRADIWAVGAILFEMLTGSLPFPAESEGDLVYSIMSRSPARLTDLRPAAPFALEQIVRKAMARDPRDRYVSAEALAQDLRQLRDQDRPTAIEKAVQAQLDPDTRSIAVLTFVNITRDPDDDWLSTGITETLMVDLNKIRELRVVDRQKVRRAVGTGDVAGLGAEDFARIGLEIGARWLCTGAFQRAGDAVRITAELFDVVEGAPVESMKMDGTMQEIFSLQDHLVTGLGKILELEVSEADLRRIERPETTDLQAWEYYAKGRKLINELATGRLAEAERYMLRAIEVDPGYALAHSGLGMLRTTRYISAADPAELEVALDHLQRAVDLDKELGDPYLWLSYAYARLNRFQEAISAGQTAVRLEPENPLSHYFLGAALWLRGISEFRMDAWPEGVEHLKKACGLAPKLQTAHQVIGDIYLRHGQYEDALAHWSHAAELEEAGTSEPVQFLGGVTLLGILEIRLGLWSEARAHLSVAMSLLSDADHVYQPVFAALTRCGQAMVALHERQLDEALHLYRVAGEIVTDNASSLGIGWVLIRCRLGMARCFHQLGMTREEQGTVDEALGLMRDRSGLNFSANWESGDSEMYYELASYSALAGSTVTALEYLERAVECGWRELPRLEADQGFDPLRDNPQYQRIAEGLEAIPRLP